MTPPTGTLSGDNGSRRLLEGVRLRNLFSPPVQLRWSREARGSPQLRRGDPRGNPAASRTHRRIYESNHVHMAWKDWTPKITFTPGPRTCDSAGQCVYPNATLTATVKQPLEPGVVTILYQAKGCLPKPGDPAGDPGCKASSPKDCSPGVAVCTYTGGFAAGYNPGAVVVTNGPRPMMVYGSTFLYRRCPRAASSRTPSELPCRERHEPVAKRRNGSSGSSRT